ncbi:MAG TPA: M10 family metallopeptidase C-terminal domain-containing protein [Allosphingosinicella sp.]
MCWMCDQDGRSNLTNQYWGNKLGISATHFGALSSGKATTAPLTDGSTTGFAPDALLVVGADEAGSGIGVAPGNPALIVGGTPTVATLQTIGDEDYFQVTLEAGKTYEIGQFAKIGGPSGTPLADAYFEIYDAAGNLLLSVDGGGPNTPSGLDALSTFTPQAGGVYFINARAFDQDPTNGTKGDAVGDYELFVKEVEAGAPVYTPFYDINSPLHSLDWGSEFARSSRNPDGDNGTRSDNGVTQADLLTDSRAGIEGKNVIRVYFAKQGDVFVSSDPTTPGVTADIVQVLPITEAEKAAYRLAFEQYENVADLIYIEVDNRNEADLTIITYKGTPGPGASLLGRASPPGEESAGQMEFNSGDERYTDAGLTQGGFFFTTLLHEFGHAHGMAHPHDNGGRSSIMRGAGGGTGGIGGAYGDFGLSQGVFTVMSYNDGYDLRPDGTKSPDDSKDNGWVGTLSPLDIAVIQDKYGVNEEYRTGNDTYVIKDVQEKGTFYASIWDGGGVDEIVYEGARNTVVDLRAATLKYEEGGGGRVSYATGIHGGFTVANGVTIENARSGAGNDTVNGNDVANKLSSGAGNDTVNGFGGDDTISGGAGKDILTGGAGKDTFLFAELADSGVGVDRDVITDFVDGEDVIQLDSLGGKSFIGSSAFTGSAGQVRVATSTGQTIVELDSNGDGVADLQIELTGGYQLDKGDFILAVTPGQTLSGTRNSDTLRGGEGDDTLGGLGGNDTLIGGDGDDRLNGGADRDTLTGGTGADIFVFDTANHTGTRSSADRITDFQSGLDLIDLSAIDANRKTAENDAFTFIGGANFSKKAGELRYSSTSSGTYVSGDTNGDGVADFEILLVNKATPVVTDFLL